MATSTQKLLSLYEQFPFHEHPLWQSVLKHELSLAEIMLAETQHWLRTRAGQKLRAQAVANAQAISETIFAAVVDTYLEECTSTRGTPSHLELIERLVKAGGVNDADLASAAPTPGNSAAIALYQDIGRRGAACHILGAGAVEHYYATLAPKVFRAYTQHYGLSEHAAETYKLHGPMDAEHANRAMAITDEAIRIHGWDVIEISVRDAFVATSLHYDGMLQAATRGTAYWGGRS